MEETLALDTSNFGRVRALPGEVTDFLATADKAVSGALWWFNPTHLTRVLAGGAGLVAILLGVLFLSREVR